MVGKVELKIFNGGLLWWEVGESWALRWAGFVMNHTYFSQFCVSAPLLLPYFYFCLVTSDTF